MLTGFVPTRERVSDQYPLLLTTGRILTQYNVGTQTRRTANSQWHPEDVLEMSLGDMQTRGLRAGDSVTITSRFGSTRLKVVESARVNPGVIYTTFHHAETKANVVTSDLSDWATNCPEYKVTAVEVTKVTSPERQRAKSSVTRPAQQEREAEEIAVAEEV
jgi:formate dehydrogenase major subunit